MQKVVKNVGVLTNKVVTQDACTQPRPTKSVGVQAKAGTATEKTKKPANSDSEYYDEEDNAQKE